MNLTDSEGLVDMVNRVARELRTHIRIRMHTCMYTCACIHAHVTPPLPVTLTQVSSASSSTRS